MGERYVWEYAALEINGEKAASLLKEGIRRGSACAVLLAMRCGELTPSARKAMPFASLKEARDDVLSKAEAGHPFCQYMIGNTYYFGDCFEIDGIDPQTAFHDPDGLRADTARHALPWLEKALNGGLSDAAKNLYNLFSGSEGFPRDRGRQWEIAFGARRQAIRTGRNGAGKCAVKNTAGKPKPCAGSGRPRITGRPAAGFT